MEHSNQSPFDVRNRRLADARSRPEPSTSPCAACSVRHLTVCAALEGDELQQLADIVHNVELEAGQPLFDEGERADYVFNVTAGCVKVYKLLPDGRRQVTGFLFAGDFLGLANQDTYAFSAEAVSPATLCRFQRGKLESAMERFPQLEKRLLGVASHELAIAQEQMLLLGRKTAKERLASFLIKLSESAQRRGQPTSPVRLPMTRADIGDYLGLTTETVSRVMTQLKGQGTISLLPNGQVDLRDLETLEDLAGGY